MRLLLRLWAAEWEPVYRKGAQTWSLCSGQMCHLGVIYESKITLFMSIWEHLFNSVAWGLLLEIVFAFFCGLLAFDGVDSVSMMVKVIHSWYVHVRSSEVYRWKDLQHNMRVASVAFCNSANFLWQTDSITLAICDNIICNSQGRCLNVSDSAPWPSWTFFYLYHLIIDNPCL